MRCVWVCAHGVLVSGFLGSLRICHVFGYPMDRRVPNYVSDGCFQSICRVFR